MNSRMKIGSKIILVTIPITMIAVILAAVISGYKSKTALAGAAFERLTAVRELKSQQIEGYFEGVASQVQFLAADQTTVSALTSLISGISQIESGIDSYDKVMMPPIHKYYTDLFGQHLEETSAANKSDGNHAGLMPSDPVALFLQNEYLLETDVDIQKKPKLASNADQAYRLRHNRTILRFADLLAKFGYKDVYLIDPDSGRIIFSVAKSIDFGTSLFEGPHSKTSLARVAMEATKLDPGGYVFADFEPYTPSFGEPTAFVAAPVFVRDYLKGVLAFQLSVDDINSIMTSHQSWQDVGLGVSGETYLVGDDMLLRNQSRFLIEDKDQYLEMILGIGMPEDIVRQIEIQGNSIGLQKVDTIGTRAALSGETNTEIFSDYRGVEVLSSYRPLNIPGVNWVIMSEIDTAEALAEFEQLRDLLIVLASVILAAAVFIAYYFSLSLTGPIRALAGVAENLSTGNLDERVDAHSGDEIGDLARSFEKMRSSMKATFHEVEEQKSHLESEVRRQTNELKETSDQLNSALSSMPNGIHMLDEDLNFVLFNKQYLEQMGIPDGLLSVGTNVRKVLDFHVKKGDFGQENPEARVQRIMDDYKDRSTSRVESKLANGRTIDIQFSYLDSGDVIGVTSDITDLKRKERDLVAQNDEMALIQAKLKGSEQRVAKVIQSSPDGIIGIDQKGIIQSFSASAERIFGYFSDEIIGKNIKILMPKSIAIEHDYYLEKYIPGEPSTIVGKNSVVDAVRKDGSSFPMELRVALIELENNEVMYIGTTRDITVQLQMEAEVESAREDAIAANAAKSAFLANMSHELRTPMNAIIGYSEMLAEDAEDDQQEDVLEDLKKITAAGRHLLSLINDVLDLSKIEAGKMELFIETFIFSDLASEVADTAQTLVKTNGNMLIVEIGEGLDSLDGDLTKTRQMLFNLISNAAKFTKDGTITLAGEKYINRGSDWIRISVSDTGIGVPADKLEKIFQEFSQADETTTKNYGGTGLGLSLTRRFAQMMGGDIRVESKEGSGSSFIIEIPMKVTTRHEGLEAGANIDDEDPGSVEASSQSPSDLLQSTLVRVQKGRPLVLVVDDELNARKLLTKSLEKEGCEVKVARDGAEGLEMAAKLHPDLITLDIMMPGVDGWTVLRKLKADQSLRDIPVLMVSMIGDRGMSYELGAVDSIQKPVDRAKLRGFVEKYAKGKRNNVLLVEDDAGARRNLKLFMEKVNWKVTEAENGALGLEAVEGKKFDLILLDLMMPVMDGFEFLHNLRDSESPSANAPVVVVTAKDLDSQDRARLAGSVDDIVLKSGGSVEQIMEEVKAALGGAWTGAWAKSQ